MIFSVLFSRPFYIFSREQCNTKITELLDVFGIKGRLLIDGKENEAEYIDYNNVLSRIEVAKKDSLDFLTAEITKYL